MTRSFAFGSVPVDLPPAAVQAALDLDTVQEGGVVTYRLVLPFLPPSKNVANNWKPEWRTAAKRKWCRYIAQACDELGVPRDNKEMGLAAALVFATKSRRDPQNYAQELWHWVPDALVRCGRLVDDNEGRLAIGPNWGIRMLVDERRAPKKAKERTVLTLSVRKAVPRA